MDRAWKQTTEWQMLRGLVNGKVLKELKAVAGCLAVYNGSWEVELRKTQCNTTHGGETISWTRNLQRLHYVAYFCRSAMFPVYKSSNTDKDNSRGFKDEIHEDCHFSILTDDSGKTGTGTRRGAHWIGGVSIRWASKRDRGGTGFLRHQGTAYA